MVKLISTIVRLGAICVPVYFVGHFCWDYWQCNTLPTLDVNIKEPAITLKVAESFERGNSLLESGKIKEALTLFTPLARDGYSYAQFKLGEVYYNGELPGDGRDYEKAKYWLREAAVRGDRDAQSKLGRLYEDLFVMKHGFNGRFDRYSVAWHREAAGRGNSASQWAFGMWQLTHRGVKRIKPTDAEEAYAQLKLADVAGAGMSGIGIVEKLLTADQMSRARRKLDEKLLSFEEGCRRGEAYYGDRDLDLMCAVHNFILNMLYEQDRSAYRAMSKGMPIEDLSGMEIKKGVSDGIILSKSVQAGTMVVVISGNKSPGSQDSLVFDSSGVLRLLRPGDVISLSDGLTDHIVTLHSIDRANAMMHLIDGWPDSCMLLENRNTEGVKGKIEPIKNGRRLVRVSFEELSRVIVGFSSLSLGREQYRAYASRRLGVK